MNSTISTAYEIKSGLIHQKGNVEIQLNKINLNLFVKVDYDQNQLTNLRITIDTFQFKYNEIKLIDKKHSFINGVL